MKDLTIKTYVVAICGLAALLGLIFALIQKGPGLPKGPHALGEKPYLGQIYHIFFHSLIVYPELAYQGDSSDQGFKDYMITRKEFTDFLDLLYKENFILVDITSLYKINSSGEVERVPLFLPGGKKALIISLDDLSYYTYMKGRGFANKLVLDANSEVATEVITPEGKKIVTRDGDVVPLLDDFVKEHPDFSYHGAKGVIALTGFEGILGYRTQSESASREKEVRAVLPIVSQLKSTGWKFANHSFSHNDYFREGYISLDGVKNDTMQWKSEVEPLVGKTDVFIGPFGQIFRAGDPRRTYLVDQGFKVLCGVGIDGYFEFTPYYLAMNRADIDGYRLTHDPERLKRYLSINK